MGDEDARLGCHSMVWGSALPLGRPSAGLALFLAIRDDRGHGRFFICVCNIELFGQQRGLFHLTNSYVGPAKHSWWSHQDRNMLP